MPYTKRPKVTRNLQGEVRDEENERGKSKARDIPDQLYWAATINRDRFWLHDKDTSDELRQEVGLRLGLEQIEVDRLLYKFGSDEIKVKLKEKYKL